MSLSTAEHVRGLFIEATRQALVKELRTPEDAARFAEIAREAETRIDTEEIAFREDYTTRLAEAREVILREQTGLTLDRPRPRQIAHISDKAVLDHHADARVRRDHLRRIATIRADERDDYQGLREEIAARDGPRRTPSHTQSRGRSGPTQQR